MTRIQGKNISKKIFSYDNKHSLESRIVDRYYDIMGILHVQVYTYMNRPLLNVHLDDNQIWEHARLIYGAHNVIKYQLMTYKKYWLTV